MEKIYRKITVGHIVIAVLTPILLLAFIGIGIFVFQHMTKTVGYFIMGIFIFVGIVKLIDWLTLNKNKVIFKWEVKDE